MSKHFKRYETSFRNPDVVNSIDDATESVGDWPEIDDHCDKSQSGHHEYDALRDPERCKWCGRVT